MSNTGTKSWLRGGTLFWPMAGWLLLLGFNLIFSPSFFHLEVRDGHLYGTLVDILNQGSKVMLLSIGMTLVIAIGGVDLSVGSVMAIAGAIAAMLVTKMAFVWVVTIAVGVSALAGACNGMLIGWLGLQPIIATLILMVAGRGVAMLLTGGQIITFEDKAFVYLGNGHLAGLPFTVTIVVVVTAVTLLVTRKTAIGLLLEASGDNERAAKFCGINVALVKIMVYAACGFCAGVAGLIATSNIKAADSSRVGEMMELDAIFAVVVGGTPLTGGRFTLLGSIIGALLIQTLATTMYNLGVPPAVATVPKAIVIVAVCLMQSNQFRARVGGLWGRRAGRVKKIWSSPHLPLVATLLVMIVLFSTASVMYQGFFSGRVVTNLIGDNATLGIAAIGATLVILAGGIDLSVGAVLGFTTIFVAVLVQQHHMPPLVAIALALGVGTLFGWAMGFLIDRFDLPPFLVTLGGMFFARGMGFAISPESVGIEDSFYSRLSDLAIPLGGKASLSATGITYLALLAVGIVVTHYTSLGKNIYAVGGNESSARLMGVPIGRTKLIVYAIGGFCAALAGVVSTIYTGSGNPTLGVGFELDVIAAVVVGGTLLTGGVGSQLGTVAGVLIFGTIQTALVFDGRLNSWWLRIAIGGLLLVFILLQRFLSLIRKLN